MVAVIGDALKQTTLVGRGDKILKRVVLSSF